MKERRSRLSATRTAKSRAQLLRADLTHAEQALWESLRDRRLEGLKFRRQSPIGIFIVDFHCRELSLVVEVDGECHTEKRQSAHDRNRDFYLRSLGCTVLRISNREILEEPPGALSRILETAANLQKPRT